MPELEKTSLLQEMIGEIGSLLRAGKPKEAVAAAEKAVDFAKDNFGEEDINTAVTLSTLGGCLSKDNQHEKGRDMLEKALAILLKQPGDCALQIAQVKNNISVTYRQLFMPQKALANAVDAFITRSRLLGTTQMETSVSVANIGFIFSWMGLIDLALACYELAYASNPSNTGAKNNYQVLLQAVHDDNRFTPGPTLPDNFELTYPALAALCEFMLSKPLPEEFFLITNGQPAHRESYLHYIYQLKAASIKIFGDQNKPEEQLFSIVQNARQKLCAATSLPLYKETLVLKRIERSKLHALGQATLTYAFPGFSIEINAIKKKMGIKSAHKSFNDLKIEELKETGIPFTYSDKQYRRYAGDNNLPASCYYSICHSLNGDDQQTLCKELFEYTDLDIPGLVWVSDSWDTAFMDVLTLHFPKNTALSPGIYVLLLRPLDPQENLIYQEFYAPVFKELNSSEGLSIIHIPIEIIHKEAEHVVDLRQLPTQDWFRIFFGKGDGAVFLKDVTTLPADFTDMLPALTYPEYGGSGVTKSIGTWLRLAGVNGLVYPSARADASVEYDATNNLTNSGGWNFIDYTKSNLIPDRETHIDLHEWYDFIPGRQEAPALKVNGKSWKIEGAEKRYKVVRQFFIDFLTQTVPAIKT